MTPLLLFHLDFYFILLHSEFFMHRRMKQYFFFSIAYLLTQQFMRSYDYLASEFIDHPVFAGYTSLTDTTSQRLPLD